MALETDGRVLLTARAWMMAALVLAIGALGLSGPPSHAQPPKDKSEDKGKRPLKRADKPVAQATLTY